MLRLAPDDEPHELFDHIRATGELVPSRLGFHLTATYHVAKTLLQDERFGVTSPARMAAASTAAGPPADHPIDGWFVFRNPPEHTRLRRVVAPFFTGRAVDALTPVIRRIVGETADDVAVRPEFDLVGDFALRLSMRTVCAVLGVPRTEFEQLLRWGPAVAESLHETPDEARADSLRTALEHVADYFSELVRRRARQPGDDLVSWLIAARSAGQITTDEIIACCQLLVVAGFETMASLFSEAVQELSALPQSGVELTRSTDQMSAFIDEVLRLHPPVRWVSRRTRERVSLAGVELPADAGVAVLVAGANRDPAEFSSPDRLDLARPNSRRHLAFAAGAHYCLGAGLARRQTAIALTALLHRYPGLRPAGPARYGPSRTLRTALSMPMRGAAPTSPAAA